MKNKITIWLILILTVSTFPSFAQSQDYTEWFHESGIIYFSTTVSNPEIIQQLDRIISVEKVEGDNVLAYANKAEFEQFLKLGLPWQKESEPEIRDASRGMLDEVNLREIDSWDFYPTYSAYLDIMNQFATDYPDLCETFSIGQSVEGRELMVVKISDNIGEREAEPQFLYTGTMHGDELAGYILLLRLADYLLSNYGIDPEITDLVNSTEIWINPLANPDGTYRGGNNTVWGSVRYNANYVNLNRNYPDPDDGPHPDGNPYQPETLAFMQLAEDNHFVMSANTHGGAEVINYPWDTWAHLTADNNWWVFVSREYADTVHEYAPSYYLDGFNDGITNGYAWYTITGGRQDYMNYYHQCREVTMELSNTKKLSESLLEAHWNWNHRSLINYIRQCTYGVGGTVTDDHSGAPVAAKVFIDGHDEDHSFATADPANGYYKRLIYPGTYDITFSASGYLPVTVQNISVSNYSAASLNIQLTKSEQNIALKQGWSGISIYVEPENTTIETMLSEISGDMEILIGNQGIYWPPNGINTIINWDVNQGYIIKMNAPSNLAVPGIPNEGHTIGMKAGWNYFPVVCNVPLMVSDVDAALSGKLVLVKEIAGVNTYWPAMGIFTLMNLEPGKAYLLYLNATASFTFPDFE